jgi:hypothetical protein
LINEEIKQTILFHKRVEGYPRAAGLIGPTEATIAAVEKDKNG